MMKEYSENELKLMTERQLHLIIGAGVAGDYRKRVFGVLLDKVGDKNVE